MIRRENDNPEILRQGIKVSLRRAARRLPKLILTKRRGFQKVPLQGEK